MAPDAISGPRQRTIFTVSEISRRIRDLVEAEFTDVWVEGEVSNLRRSAAGHIYFTLKDERSQLPAVCFRSAALYLRFKPKNGESFRARGRLSVYEGRGEYQIVVEVLEPTGRGALQAAFERLKEKLEREGLFDAERKRALPEFPSRVGIVTSPRSAALRDILSVLERRHDAIDVLVYPTDVQGDSAGARIAEGVRTLGGADVDLVIVTRGGGSAEDLWPFNEEQVARAIAACPKPVVSAVGHETDFTISDFVADLRAPTPSAAAEMVVRTKRELVERLNQAEGRMHGAIRRRVVELRQFLAARVGGRGFAVAQGRMRALSQSVDDCVFRLERVVRTGEWIGARRRRLDYGLEAAGRSVGSMLQQSRRSVSETERALANASRRALLEARRRVSTAGETLGALSPLGVLERGFSICRTLDGDVVRSAEHVPIGGALEVILRRGALRVQVIDSRTEDDLPREPRRGRDART